MTLHTIDNNQIKRLLEAKGWKKYKRSFDKYQKGRYFFTFGFFQTHTIEHMGKKRSNDYKPPEVTRLFQGTIKSIENFNNLTEMLNL